jgi:putative tricarboxylic transport membrane protein
MISADRASGLFFFGFGLLMVLVVNPRFIEDVDTGNIRPETVPNWLALIIAACGAILAVRPADRRGLDWRQTGRAAVFLGILGFGIWAMSHVGFVIVAPPLVLAVMLLIGERRPAWLALGVGGMPALIWLLVDVLLGRPLP